MDRSLFRRRALLLITLGAIVGAILAVPQPPAARAAEPDLIITGTGLKQDVLIYPGDWGKYTEIERFYSSNNNYDYHKIWKVKGYDLFELMGAQNLKTDQDYPVTFIAKDNTRTTRTVSALKSLYYYPKFTVDTGKRVAPMIGFYRAALYEPADPGRPNPAEVIWQDRPLRAADRDDKAPRLYLGQAARDVDDNNQSFFLRELARIVVGEERPQNNTGGQNGNGASPSGGGAAKEQGGKPSPPGARPAAPAPEKGPGAGAAAAPGEAAEEPGKEASLAKEAAAAAEKGAADAAEEESRLARVVVEAKTRVAESTRSAGRWWIAALVLLSGGAAGAGCYYYFRKRGADHHDG